MPVGIDSSAAVPIATWASEALYWIFIALLILNLVQRRHQKRGEKKRFATLFLALGMFAFLLVAQGIVSFGGQDWMLLPGAAAILAVLYRYRSKTWPFRLHSPKDGRRLTWDEIL